MLNPAALYRLEPDTDAVDLNAATLIVALDGFMDAGHAQRILTAHLLAELDHTVVATFDADQLFDYRGRRPLMTFTKDRWVDFSDPSLTLYRVIDRDGVPFLMLVGFEPDYQWERFVEAVRQLNQLLGVRLTASMNGIPMAVPHTRPIGRTVHATHDHLKGHQPALFDSIKVPASLTSLLELRLGESGEQAVGFAIHVPHYVSQLDYPAAAIAGLEALSTVTGLSLPIADLQVSATDSLRVITAQVEATDDAREVVSALEAQYDAFVNAADPMALMAKDESTVPTAEELGREFEEFLRSRAGE